MRPDVKENELRKCLFKIYNTDNGRPVLSEYINGLFHRWGIESTDYDNGGCENTVAIVEDLGGYIHTVVPCNLQFIN